MKHTGKRRLSVLVTLVFVIGLLPVMALTARADEDGYLYIWNDSELRALPYKSDAQSDGWDQGSGWQYVKTTNTLTLKNCTITVSGDEAECAISYQGDQNGYEPLTIVLEGNNEINGSEHIDSDCIQTIYSTGNQGSDVIIQGEGTLTLKAIKTPISLSDGSLHIEGGSVTAIATGEEENNYYGIVATSVSIGKDVTSFVAAGAGAAIYGTVNTDIPGTGWTDTAGTEGKKDISVESGAGLDLTKYKKVKFPRHLHNFTYAAGTGDAANTIIATCSEANCDLPVDETSGNHTARLTIKAPESPGYDGKAKAATVIDTFGIQGDVKIMYEKKTGESTYDTATETAPIDAGTYKATITLGEATASVEYTIAPAVIDSVALLIDKPVAGKNLATTATTNANVTLLNSGAITWDPTAPQDGKAAYVTEYTASVTATATGNYTFADGDITATVNSNPATVTKNQDGSLSISYTFPKTNLNPVTITAEDVAVTYAPDGIAIPANGMFTIPQDAGAPTYGVENGTGKGTFANNKLTVTECGTFTVTVNTAETDTHAAAKASAKLTVNKASSTPATVTANALTYTGGELALVSVDDSKLVGGDMQYALGKDDQTLPTSGWVGDIPKGKDADKYFVWYRVKGDKNHDTSAGKCVTVTIDEAASIPATVTANTLTYTGTAQALVTVDDSRLVGGDMQYALGTDDQTSPTSGWGADIPKGTEAKKYYVWYRVKVDKNHSASAEKCVTATIDKADSTPATVTANALTYTGQAQALVTVDKSTLVGGDMQYALGDNDKTSPASGWGADIPKGTEAKKYYVWYRVKAARGPEAGNAGVQRPGAGAADRGQGVGRHDALRRDRDEHRPRRRCVQGNRAHGYGCRNLLRLVHGGGGREPQQHRAREHQGRDCQEAPDRDRRGEGKDLRRRRPEADL